MQDILPAYSSFNFCQDYDIHVAFITACFWISYNVVIMGVSSYYGSSVTHRSLSGDYYFLWFLFVLNFTSAALLMNIYSKEDPNLKVLDACIGLSSIAIGVSTLIILKTVCRICTVRIEIQENDLEKSKPISPENQVKSSEERLQTFYIVQILLMLVNNIYAGVIVGFIIHFLNAC
ncbi:Oidioi.mRNA.OKI2018_I69.PAR.g12521.t1.cds [Oikopleura dioica]|uniref:Oidioi.mRNA.OKI2018_I69.PAR.g12521.t1.cds n=1 Tax=Oikopleura dioica TaxID=34765 RepID=A0ABN7S5Z5_OIKDI|nr:Oidioi.mRNA.OKI2018_I69.PAR.g12521.t1.cds [Oikopleura dioica]